MGIPAGKRREEIRRLLGESGDRVLSAGELAARFDVSRQIIVGDIAILRAGGEEILSTARGYRLARPAAESPKREEKPGAGIVRVIACRHGEAELKPELYTIVDGGGEVLDISVTHPVYGELTAPLYIQTRADADALEKSLSERKAAPLLTLADGSHRHTVRFPDEESYARVTLALQRLGILEKEFSK